MQTRHRGLASLLAGLAACVVTITACQPVIYLEPAPSHPPITTPADRRFIPDEVLARKAICYSGYRTGQSPATQTYPSEAEIKADLELLIAEGFGFIRIYDTSVHGQRVLKVIKDNGFDLKVLLGVWIDGPKQSKDAINQVAIQKGIELADAYPTIVVAVSVGNETMVDWSNLKVPPADMKGYIEQVRDAVAQPVGTDDNWEPFSFKHEDGSPYDTVQVAQAVDFLAIHSYAYWDSYYDLWNWKQESVAAGGARATAMMNAALEHTKANVRAVRQGLADRGLNTPILIGETGWGDNPADTRFVYRAHPVNQKMYYDRVQSWVYGAAKDSESPLACFYFEAFNEPWKGNDDNWGLWKVDRTKKYVLSGTGYNASQALYYVAPVVNPAVTETTYWLFGAGAPGSDVKLRELWNEWKWSAWENGTTAATATLANGNQAGNGDAVQITPSPLSWGWGMAMALTQGVTNSSTQNLSNFSAGHLRFKVKTSYPGKIEVGFRDSGDAYLTINPASNTYGYANDGNWHEVSIPIADIKAVRTGVDLSLINDAFVIANRYSVTGNTPSSGGTNPIVVDAIRWTKN